MSEYPTEAEEERQRGPRFAPCAGYVPNEPKPSQSRDLPGSSGSAKAGDGGDSSPTWIKDFGPTLKDIREQEGMTQEELAQKAGLTAMHISHFECGRRLPSLPNFRALLVALGDDYSACLLDMRTWNNDPPEYQEFLSECAKQCRCSMTICESVLCGAPCEERIEQDDYSCGPEMDDNLP